MILGKIVGLNYKNSTKEGETISEFANKRLARIFFKEKSFGIQDGGSLIFALFMKKILHDIDIDSNIVLFSRSLKVEDHFALQVNSSKYETIYIDSDGIHKEDDMIQKLKNFEFIDASLFENINISRIRYVDKDEYFVNELYGKFKDDLKEELGEFKL